MPKIIKNVMVVPKTSLLTKKKLGEILNFTKFIMSKLLYAKKHKKRHGWAKKDQIFSY